MRYPEEMWLALCARIRAQVRVLRAEQGYVPAAFPIERRLAAIPGATMRTVPGNALRPVYFVNSTADAGRFF